MQRPLRTQRAQPTGAAPPGRAHRRHAARRDAALKTRGGRPRPTYSRYLQSGRDLLAAKQRAGYLVGPFNSN